jgi:CDP-diacylglycerol--serine O-phosphatidyltransferase
MIEPGSGSFELVRRSVILLLLAGLADFVDGVVARAFKSHSDFGIMFDSMADAVSFGVAPSVICLKVLSLEQGSIISFFAATGAMIYSLCGVLRLVRFNIKSIEAKGNIVEMTIQKKHFTGLPTPAAAAAAVSANLILLSPFVSQHFEITNLTRSIILTVINIILGYLMVSRWKFPSLKGLHFRVPSFYLVFLTVVIAIFFLYGIFHYFSLIFVILAWSYILIAFVLSLIRIIAGKKSKTLKDFDPDDDDDDELNF